MSKIFQKLKETFTSPKPPKFKIYEPSELKILAMRTRVILQTHQQQIYKTITKQDHQFKEVATNPHLLYQVLQDFGQKVIEIESIKILIQMLRKIQNSSAAIVRTNGDLSLLRNELLWFQSVLWYRKQKQMGNLEEINDFCLNFFKGVDITQQANLNTEVFRVYPVLKYLANGPLPLQDTIQYYRPYLPFEIDFNTLSIIYKISNQKLGSTKTSNSHYNRPPNINGQSNIPYSSNINLSFNFPTQPINPFSNQNANYGNSLNYNPQPKISFNTNYQNLQGQLNIETHPYNSTIKKQGFQASQQPAFSGESKVQIPQEQRPQQKKSLFNSLIRTPSDKQSHFILPVEKRQYKATFILDQFQDDHSRESADHQRGQQFGSNVPFRGGNPLESLISRQQKEEAQLKQRQAQLKREQEAKIESERKLQQQRQELQRKKEQQQNQRDRQRQIELQRQRQIEQERQRQLSFNNIVIDNDREDNDRAYSARFSTQMGQRFDFQPNQPQNFEYEKVGNVRSSMLLKQECESVKQNWNDEQESLKIINEELKKEYTQPCYELCYFKNVK